MLRKFPILSATVGAEEQLDHRRSADQRHRGKEAGAAAGPLAATSDVVAGNIVGSLHRKWERRSQYARRTATEGGGAT